MLVELTLSLRKQHTQHELQKLVLDKYVARELFLLRIEVYDLAIFTPSSR